MRDDLVNQSPSSLATIVKKTCSDMATVTTALVQIGDKIKEALGRGEEDSVDLVEVIPLIDELIALRSERAESDLRPRPIVKVDRLTHSADASEPGSLGTVVNDPNAPRR